MKKVFFLSAVSGVGKTTTCHYIENNNLLKNYSIFDIDELENINEYNSDTYTSFYENALKKAVLKSKNENILIGSCINPTDIKKIKMPEEITSLEMILIFCSSEELERRLKKRDKERNCSSDEFIQRQIEYQNFMLNHLDLYRLYLDNSNCDVNEIAIQIVNYINSYDTDKSL